MTSFERLRPLRLAAGLAMNRVFDVVLGVASKQQRTHRWDELQRSYLKGAARQRYEPSYASWGAMLAEGEHIWGKYNDVHRHCSACLGSHEPCRTWREQWLIEQGMRRVLSDAEHQELAGLRGHTPSVAIGDGHA